MSSNRIVKLSRAREIAIHEHIAFNNTFSVEMAHRDVIEGLLLSDVTDRLAPLLALNSVIRNSLYRLDLMTMLE